MPLDAAAVRGVHPTTAPSSVTLRARSRLRLLLVCAIVAAIAWLSQGTIAYTGSGTDRIGVLPLSLAAAAWLIGAAGAVGVALGRGASALPLVALALPALSWLPIPVPAAFQMWTGPLGLLAWFAAALGVAATCVNVRPRAGRGEVAAGLVACVVYAFAAWEAAPSVPGGDEPHYLVITQSLLKDGDLRIENNHRQGDYQAYYAGALNPDFRVRGRDREIYSIHAPGVSALVLPAFAVAGYPGVVGFLIVLAAVASALAYHLAMTVTGRTDAAWFGWAAVTMSATAVFHSFSVYPDGPGGLLVLTGIWALLRTERERASGSERVLAWALHGAALALLPWLHTRFAVLAGGLGAVLLLRLGTTRNPAAKAAAFLAVPAVSALAWIGYFVAIYGTPDPSAPYGNEPGSLAYVPGGLTGILFDQRFGLLAYAPVLAFAFGGVVVMLRHRSWRRLSLELLFVLVPYLLVVTHFAMWWGGHSAPARFLVPVLPALAIPAAAAWTAIAQRATRATAVAALAFTVFASAVLVLVDGGRLAYNTRETNAAWLEWLNQAVDLGRGLPAFWRGRLPEGAPGIGWGGEELGLYRDTAIWIAALGAAWLVLRAWSRSTVLSGRGAFTAATAGVYAAAAMLAVGSVWAVARVDGTTKAPAQLEVVRRIGAERALIAFDAGRFGRLSLRDVPPMLRIVPEPSSLPGGAGRNDRPLYSVPRIPAGEYRLTLSGAAGTWVMLGIGRDQFAIRTEQLGSPSQPIQIRFPVDVRAIVLRTDDQPRARPRRLVIEPLSVVPPADAISRDFARRAVRYGDATVFFMDERSFPEPEAFWVGGARTATVVLQPDAPRAVAPLVIRNGAADNSGWIQAGGWREEWRLAPGEERRVEVPLDPGRGATLVTFSSVSGFRPSAIEPASRDDRFLGLWVKPGP